MLVGYVDLLSQAWVTGWACDLAAPDRELDVGISVDGREVAVVRADLLREDLRDSGKHGSGRHGFVFGFSEALSPDTSHRVKVYVTGSSKPLNNGERELEAIDAQAIENRLQQSPVSDLQPVFLTHVPRSGSTFVMDVLSRHPEVVIARHYPHEVKVATYYANAAHVLSHPAELRKPVNPTEFMRDSSAVGFNPFDHFNFHDVFQDKTLHEYFFRGHAPRATRELFRALTKRYYMCIALDSGRTPRCFVEKCELESRLQARLADLFPYRREIVLVRDMRDVYCSYRSYFPNATREYAMGVLVNSARHLVRMKNTQSTNSTFIRYEDCIADPVAVFDGVWRFLNITSCNVFDADDDGRLFAIHATSGSVTASIGRWNRDLSDEEKHECSTRFGEFLAAFGYES